MLGMGMFLVRGGCGVVATGRWAQMELERASSGWSLASPTSEHMSMRSMTPLECMALEGMATLPGDSLGGMATI